MAVVTDFTALLFDGDAFRWNGARDLGTPVIVTYSFADRVAELPDESEFPDKTIGDFTTGFSDPGQQQIVRDAFAIFEAAAGVRFVEVETGGMIHLVEATSVLSGGFQVSFASIPAVNAVFGSLGVAVLNQDHFPLDQGEQGFGILLHELGHGLGLDHTDEGTNTLDPAVDIIQNSIMQSVSTEVATTIGVFDEQALEFLYGDFDAFNVDALVIAEDAVNGEVDILGTSGADRFVAPNFRSNVDAGDGDDAVFGNEPGDEIDGEGGDDLLIGGGGDDVLRGGAGADVLDGLGFLQGNFLGGADQLFGGDGDDTLVLRFDTVLYSGGDGDDTLDGSSSSQVVVQLTDTATFSSIEHAILSPGNDFFRGDTGDDDVKGGGGDDTLIGGDGADVLNGEAGADDMDGGAGDDVYWIDDAGDAIFETSGTDLVKASIAFTLPNAIENGEALGAGLLSGNGFANTLGGDAGANALAGLDGNDILVGRYGDDDLSGGDGVDRLNGGAGADVMTGGDGNDIYTVDDVGDQVIELANEGVDRINAFVDYTNAGNVEFLVGKFAAVGLALAGAAGVDKITGANRINSPDTLSGEGGNDLLIGLVGDDAIDGGLGNDRIFGNSGDDVIAGGRGNDRLTGQQGADTYVHTLGDGIDTVTDFDVAEDRVDVSAHGFANAAAALAAAFDDAGGVRFDLTGSDSILLQGVAKAALGEEDVLA